MTRTILCVTAVAVAMTLGCGDDSGDDTPPPTDAGRTDTGGANDTGVPRDTGGGTDSGTAVDAGTTPDGGVDAATAPTAVATIAATGEDGSDIMGTVTFTQRGSEVEVVYAITDCPDGSHTTHIHQGDSCESRGSQGMHWDSARGEGIPNLDCAGGTGTLTYTRDMSDMDLAWTIGAPAASDLLGHPVIIHGAVDAGERIGCGVIQMP